MSRERLTWPKKASPPPQTPSVDRTEKGDHPAYYPDPEYGDFAKGDPDAWAETPNPPPYPQSPPPSMPGNLTTEEPDHPAYPDLEVMPPSTPVTASEARLYRQAALCQYIATKMLEPTNRKVAMSQLEVVERKVAKRRALTADEKDAFSLIQSIERKAVSLMNLQHSDLLKTARTLNLASPKDSPLADSAKRDYALFKRMAAEMEEEEKAGEDDEDEGKQAFFDEIIAETEVEEEEIAKDEEETGKTAARRRRASKKPLNFRKKAEDDSDEEDETTSGKKANLRKALTAALHLIGEDEDEDDEKTSGRRAEEEESEDEEKQAMQLLARYFRRAEEDDSEDEDDETPSAAKKAAKRKRASQKKLLASLLKAAEDEDEDDVEAEDEEDEGAKKEARFLDGIERRVAKMERQFGLDSKTRSKRADHLGGDRSPFAGLVDDVIAEDEDGDGIDQNDPEYGYTAEDRMLLTALEKIERRAKRVEKKRASGKTAVAVELRSILNELARMAEDEDDGDDDDEDGKMATPEAQISVAPRNPNADSGAGGNIDPDEAPETPVVEGPMTGGTAVTAEEEDDEGDKEACPDDEMDMGMDDPLTIMDLGLEEGNALDSAMLPDVNPEDLVDFEMLTAETQLPRQAGKGKQASKKPSKGALKPQPKKASAGPQRLGQVVATPSEDVADLSQLWGSVPDVRGIFGIPKTY